jgi:hypothetical protein
VTGFYCVCPGIPICGGKDNCLKRYELIYCCEDGAILWYDNQDRKYFVQEPEKDGKIIV